ncbi:hypothetical protein CEXT_581881 [Caerostris extrusa]|uniref:Uncharacterized protein n=1 Tax=Caerostris extrusa TaxID=172846 RepID=A0AAV4R4D7_CAEEX|nr:hypothetical protein CEXT_581881 [Caerostris extrusa]
MCVLILRSPKRGTAYQPRTPDDRKEGKGLLPKPRGGPLGSSGPRASRLQFEEERGLRKPRDEFVMRATRRRENSAIARSLSEDRN